MPCWAASVDVSPAWNVPLSHTGSHARAGGVSLYGHEGCASRTTPTHTCGETTSLWLEMRMGQQVAVDMFCHAMVFLT
jgi:hypothetical protein